MRPHECLRLASEQLGCHALKARVVTVSVWPTSCSEHACGGVLLSQASQLERWREQLQQELTSARSQLQELGAAQDGLRAQVCACQIVKCVLCVWGGGYALSLVSINSFLRVG